MKPLRVLVACEFSGTVRDAFRALGHDAVSCDLLPCEADPAHHIQGDVTALMREIYEGRERVDLLIAHPPCTYLTVAGMHWNTRPSHWRGQPSPERPGMTNGQVETERALDFFRLFLDAPVPHIAVENPVGVVSSRIRKPDQTVQPWQFGHRESKSTCLWLKGLPPLVPTDVQTLAPGERWENQTASGQNRLAPSPDRWKLRSKTYEGIARAMARQWSDALR